MRSTAAGPTVPPRVDPDPAQLLGQLGLRRVGVRDGHALEPVVADDVDRAPVRELGHREPRDAAERLLVVERAGEHAAGLGEQPLRLLGLLEVGDVLDHVDRLRARAPSGARSGRAFTRDQRDSPVARTR